MQQQWPVHQDNEIVSIVAEEESDGCRFRLRSDGIVSVFINPELLRDAPGYVRNAAEVPGVLFLQKHQQILQRLFNQAGKIAALEAS